MKKYSIILATIAIFLGSCSSMQYTSRQVNVAKQDIIASPTIVDIRVDYTKRINVTTQFHKTIQESMQEARYEALIQGNADVIVDPVFKVEHKGRRYKVSLTGFAGYYENSRTLYEDVQLLHQIDKADIEKYLMLHNPEVLQYMDKDGQIIQICHPSPCKNAIEK